MMTRKLIRWLLVPLAGLCVLYLMVSCLLAWHIKIVYQHTLSMPEGFYFVYDSHHYETGNIVMIKPDDSVMQLIVSREYITREMPLLKIIAANEGDFVCFNKYSVRVDERSYPLYKQDKKGKRLPEVDFCSRLGRGEFFVLGSGSDRSFDSRYFGIINQEQILGRAIKL